MTVKKDNRKKSVEWRVLNVKTGDLLPKIYKRQEYAERTVRALSQMVASDPMDNLEALAVQTQVTYST